MKITSYLLFISFSMLTLLFLESCGDDDSGVITGSIEGRVTNAVDNEPIEGVQVTIDGNNASQVTGSDGIYSFDNLPPTEYSLSFASADFQSDTKVIRVPSAGIGDGDIQLTPIDPFDLSVTILDFGTASSSESFNIINKRNGELRFSITSSTDFLSISPISGTIAQQNIGQIRVTINRADLAVGNFDEELVINTTNTLSGASESLPVRISVLDPAAAILSVSESSLGYGTDVSTRSLEITNDGEETLNWTASISEPWISISTSSGQLDPTEEQTMNVNVDRSGLSEGTYSGQVLFDGNGGDPIVTINMEVLSSNAAAVLNVSASEFDFGLNQETQELSISNSGEVDLDWSVSSSDAWLTTSSTSGTVSPTGSQSINILVDRSALSEGNYTGSLMITSNGGEATITVSMEVPSSNPEIALSASSIDFGENDDTRTLTVSNVGRQTLNWTLTETETWLAVSSASGSIAAGSSQDLTITIDRQGLADGNYSTVINFSGDGGEETVSVSMTVSGQGSGNDEDNDGIPDEVDSDDDGDGLIEVFTINDLYDIRDDLDASGTGLSGAPSGGFTGYELMNNLDFDSDDSYSDLSLKSTVTTGLGWNPIGSSNDKFNTTFEGNNFSVSNLLIDRTTDYVALFARTGILSEIRNLSVTIKFLSGSDFTAGLIGVSEGDVSNCSVDGSITSNGGSVGLLIGRHSKGDVSNCFTKGTISSSSNNIGGLIGSLGNASADVWKVEFSYSQATVDGNSHVGGLIGLTYWGSGEISKCYAMGKVTADNQTAGGFIGQLSYGEINACYSTGNVTSNSFYVGGFVGENSRTITTSYSTGSVTGSSNLGGFAGRNSSGSISSTNYWDTQTSGIDTSTGDATGQTTSQLQGQTTAAGIYVTWSVDIWDFGSATQYPALKNMPGGLNEQRN